jgi:hypothetical protein
MSMELFSIFDKFGCSVKAWWEVFKYVFCVYLVLEKYSFVVCN